MGAPSLSRSLRQGGEVDENMADTFQFEIVTPDRLVVKDVAEEMEIPGKDGYLGILPGHAPLISELGVGEITYRNANVTHRFAISADCFIRVEGKAVTLVRSNGFFLTCLKPLTASPETVM